MILENVTRLLKHYGLETDVVITSVAEDRVFGWPTTSRILDFMIVRGWNPDDRLTAGVHHGTQFAYREPGGVRPALQICFHPHTSSIGGPAYFLEIDFDYASPAGGIGSFFIHVWEVICNFLTRRKTNQQKISRLLNKRGIAKLT